MLLRQFLLLKLLLEHKQLRLARFRFQSMDSGDYASDSMLLRQFPLNLLLCSINNCTLRGFGFGFGFSLWIRIMGNIRLCASNNMFMRQFPLLDLLLHQKQLRLTLRRFLSLIGLPMNRRKIVLPRVSYGRVHRLKVGRRLNVLRCAVHRCRRRLSLHGFAGRMIARQLTDVAVAHARLGAPVLVVALVDGLVIEFGGGGYPSGALDGLGAWYVGTVDVGWLVGSLLL